MESEEEITARTQLPVQTYLARHVPRNKTLRRA
jgi:hypothetical protein